MTLRARLTRLQPRDRRALRGGAWILLLSLTMMLVVKPYVSVLTASRAMLQTDRDLFARESRAVAELPRDRQTLHASDQALLSLESSLFGGTDPVTASAELARYVSSRATQSGLRLEQTETNTPIDSADSASQGSARAAGDVNALRVAIRARGGILAVFAFLRAMESGPRLVRIERIDIVRGSTDDSFDGTLTFTATVAGLALRKAIDSVAVAEDEP